MLGRLHRRRQLRRELPGRFPATAPRPERRSEAEGGGIAGAGPRLGIGDAHRHHRHGDPLAPRQLGEAGQALDLMRMGFERMTDAQRPDIAHSLGVMLLNQNQPRQASLYFIAVLQLQNLRYSSWLHLAYAKTLLGEHDQAQQALQQALSCRPPALIPSDQMLEKALADRYQMPMPATGTP